VRLVDHDQVEVARAEEPRASVDLVDEVQHRRVGRHIYPTVGDLLRNKVHRGRVRKVSLERAHSLIHQRSSIGQEQHAFDPPRTHQLIDKRDRRASLPGAGRHHQQRSTLLAREHLVHGTNRAVFVVLLNDGLVDGRAAEVQAARASLHLSSSSSAVRKPSSCRGG